ncbi:MAG: hypothetical protein GY838_00225 [bacterium]|nr:hypothetical protein [bacterium]
MSGSGVRFSTYPRTDPPPGFAHELVNVFYLAEELISTRDLKKGLTSDAVLKHLTPGLQSLGFEVELGKRKDQKIQRPVFFGENGAPTLKYEIDAYQPEWHCGLEVEAGRAWMGNAVYRDLIQASVMVGVDWLCLAVPNTYKYRSSGRESISRDYDNTCAVADALYGHSRMKLSYKLVVIGY